MKVQSSIKHHNALFLSMAGKMTNSMTCTLAIREPMGKIVIELADDILPTTCKNFKLLCESKVSPDSTHGLKIMSSDLNHLSHCVSLQREGGEGSAPGYEGTLFSRIIKGQCASSITVLRA